MKIFVRHVKTLSRAKNLEKPLENGGALEKTIRGVKMKLTKVSRNMLVNVLIATLIVPMAMAVDLNAEPTAEEKAQFESVLEPVMKIYNLVKYSATAIAAMMLMFAGISYMSSGNDPKKRDTAKSMGSFVVIGLVLVWATPTLVNLLTS